MSEYVWLNELSQQFLERDYLLPGQSLEERADVICARAEQILGQEGFAERFKANLKKGWYSLSTPVWTNFGTTRGMPISCYGSSVGDNIEDILYTQAEVGVMTKHGGGTSAYFGDLRPRGASIRNNGESSGAVHFMSLFDKLVSVVSQGSTRRGNFAAYLPIDHKDIEEFLTIRAEGSPIQDISFGVCVPDLWMEEMIAGDQAKRRIWAKVLEARSNIGFPYIFFSGNARKGAPDVYQDGHTPITHSNLCTEIMLPDSNLESFVCCLSSMNIAHFDQWKGTDAVRLLTQFLDAVMSEFIEKASKLRFMDRAVRFAERHRAIGIGWLGWHTYLQSKMIPFESMEAKLLNVEVAKFVHDEAYAASEGLGVAYGIPEAVRGYGRRNATLLAIAPTKSSAFILGQVSEGIEPHRANFYIKDLAKGKFTIKNKHLEELLDAKGQNTPEVWQSIIMHAGSVQHLDFLTEHDRLVFKTFAEISPKEVVIQAAARQNFIDQGQSLNLMIHPSIPIKDVNALLITAWELGVKSLYYQIGVNAAQAFSREILSCVSCES